MDHFYCLFTGTIRNLLMHAKLDLNLLQEVRMRIGGPVFLYYRGQELVLTEEGTAVENIEAGIRLEEQDFAWMLETISGYSLYAFDEELKQGFLTVPGGHRIGVAGKMILENGKISCIRYISFLNIRLAHQIKGCADFAMKYLQEGGKVLHTLIVSPPCCGKTTLLRDIIRQISNGTEIIKGITVGVVDERGELAGSYRGIPQNDLGIRTDVLEGCSKGDGMRMLLRAMSPKVLAVDELGHSGDREAVEDIFHCGCKLIATMHGNSAEDLNQNDLLRTIKIRKLFERYIFLDNSGGPGTIREICDQNGVSLYHRGDTV